MRRSFFVGLICVFSVVTFNTGAAQQELVVGDIDIPSFRWGRQTATFEVTNNSDWMKYLTVQTEIRFEGTYLNPVRKVHTYYPLGPGESRVVSPVIDIPGNFGKAQLYIRLYDVVDTLDVLMASQKVFEQPFTLRFHMPEEAMPYYQEKVTLPPMVDNNPLWDSEFAHILPFLLKEGMSVEQVAALHMADTEFVNHVIDTLRIHGFMYRNKDGSVEPLFPVFTVGQAEETKAVVEQISDDFAALIEKNMPGYWIVLDSLIKAGVLTPDSNSSLDSGAVFYRPYPVIAGLLLWYNLGQSFVSGGKPLAIFSGTDPCNAMIGQFMYAVQGGDTFNGSHFYDLAGGGSRLDITFGDAIPKIKCPEGAAFKKHMRAHEDYKYDTAYLAEFFPVSAGLASPLLRTLGQGGRDIFIAARDSLLKVSAAHGYETVSVAERYWFWNQFATRTIEKLIARDVIDRRGNGQFRFSVSR